MTHTINNAKTAAVAIDYYWLPVNEDTPRGVKLQLLTVGGIATYGQYNKGATWVTHWAPLPRKPQ